MEVMTTRFFISQLPIFQGVNSGSYFLSICDSKPIFILAKLVYPNPFAYNNRQRQKELILDEPIVLHGLFPAVLVDVIGDVIGHGF